MGLFFTKKREIGDVRLFWGELWVKIEIEGDRQILLCANGGRYQPAKLTKDQARKVISLLEQAIAEV